MAILRLHRKLLYLELEYDARYPTVSLLKMSILDLTAESGDLADVD
jgi:hypothetical protein